MKKFTNSIINRAKKLFTKEYFIYTGLFFAMMVGIYLYMIFAGMASTPAFTYSEF